MVGQDVTISIPWFERVFQGKEYSSIPILSGDPSRTFKVKPSVSANDKRPLRYTVLVEGAGQYAVGGSDPDIVIK